MGATGGRSNGGGGGIPIPVAGATATGGAAGSGGGECTGDDCIVGCGNGRIDPGLGEACDDGNSASGDGCAADCKLVEKDYGCLEPGVPCVNLVRCGDGKSMGLETCDDGNVRAGDGCSDTCALEDGWDCPGPGAACSPKCGDAVLIADEQCDPPNPAAGCSSDCRLEPGFACDPPPVPPDLAPSTCHPTVCGDGTQEGVEACDDGNDVDGDGCSGACTLEPFCAGGTCTTVCGDGIKFAPEACDDGNVESGDGCSSDCLVETGFTCVDQNSDPPAQLNLAVTYRDFIAVPLDTAARHPDFEAVWEGGDVTPELVRPLLDAEGKPELEGRCSEAEPDTYLDVTICPYGQMLSNAENFATWYRDAPVNAPVPGALRLAREADDSYVFDSGGQGFYPIDDQGFTAPPATEDTVLADPIVNDGLPHNFGYTTEIRYFFQYVGGESLAFSGDDDLWVFIDGSLALDVGGLHPRTARTLEVDEAAAALGLTPGGLYEIAFFHAERHSAGSNFRLTLTGFAPASSQCDPTCGDGIVAATERCDLGATENTGSYAGCTADCRLGPYCGDGVVQMPEEGCDDGLNVTPYAATAGSGCAPGCVPPGYCGDGKVDSLFGEQCDAGAEPGSTGCSATCRLGERCGDGVVQDELGERCDDGNTVSGDGCAHDCQDEIR
jgi:fibro-slime domain-containing protein